MKTKEFKDLRIFFKIKKRFKSVDFLLIYRQNQTPISSVMIVFLRF